MKGPTSVSQPGLLGLLGIKSNGQQFQILEEAIRMNLDIGKFIYSQEPQRGVTSGQITGPTRDYVSLGFGLDVVPSNTIRMILSCAINLDCAGVAYANAQFQAYADAATFPGGGIACKVPMHEPPPVAPPGLLLGFPPTTNFITRGVDLTSRPFLMRPGGAIECVLFDVYIDAVGTIDYTGYVSYIDMPM